MKTTCATTMIVVTAILGGVGGCADSTPIDPTLHAPMAYTTVTIDSIPSGADVYGVTPDGMLTGRVGTTPYECPILLKPQYYKGAARIRIRDATAEGPTGMVYWTRKKQVGHTYEQNCLVIRMAVVKEGYQPIAGEKQVYGFYYGDTPFVPPPQHMSVTIPLVTIAQANEMQAMQQMRTVQQMQAMQQQNITIRQKKDELDTLNSGLDAIIKLGALRGLIGP